MTSSPGGRPNRRERGPARILALANASRIASSLRAYQSTTMNDTCMDSGAGASPAGQRWRPSPWYPSLYGSEADAGAQKNPTFQKFRSAPTHDAISTSTAARNHFQRTHKPTSTASEKEIRDSLQLNSPPRRMPVQHQASIHELLYSIDSVPLSNMGRVPSSRR